MNTTTIRGPLGELRWGYQRAASLGAWTITATAQGLTLTASVTSADAFRMTQPFLTFCVVRQKGAPWLWDVASLQVADGTVTAQLISQEDARGSIAVCAAEDGSALAQ